MPFCHWKPTVLKACNARAEKFTIVNPLIFYILTLKQTQTLSIQVLMLPLMHGPLCRQMLTCGQPIIIIQNLPLLNFYLFYSRNRTRPK